MKNHVVHRTKINVYGHCIVSSMITDDMVDRMFGYPGVLSRRKAVDAIANLNLDVMKNQFGRTYSMVWFSRREHGRNKST